MKLEESLINKLTESEVDEKYGKYVVFIAEKIFSCGCLIIWNTL